MEGEGAEGGDFIAGIYGVVCDAAEKGEVGEDFDEDGLGCLAWEI